MDSNADRFIPNRSLSNMDLSHHLLQNIENKSNITSKVLNLHLKSNNDLMSIYNSTPVKRSASKRSIAKNAERVLDAPELRDDFYLNLIDWSAENIISVPLNQELFLWDENCLKSTLLFKMTDQYLLGYLASTSWMKTKENFLAVSFSNCYVHIWDVNKKICLRNISTNAIKIGTLCWNQHLLSNGSENGTIHNHDHRDPRLKFSFKGHNQEVCGLKWSPDGRYLASGGNDNQVSIWDLNMIRDSKPLHVFKEHNAAIKAIGWCPFKSNVLATGGGRADKKLKLWNIYNGNCLNTVDTESQISAIFWSDYYKEIITSHGSPSNQLNIWKSADLSKVCDLTGHTNRILSMSMSPEGERVVTAGADETLRLWNCFGLDKRQKRRKLSSSYTDSALFSFKFIR